MSKAVECLDINVGYVLVDGNRMPNLPVPGETVVKGDSRCYSIAAASIIAKVCSMLFISTRGLIMLGYSGSLDG
jgi:ribonuclease HII